MDPKAIWQPVLWAAALLINSSATTAAPAADNWPQFRGRGGAGIGSTDFPTHFGAELNLLWKVSVPAGNASPCIWENRIFLTGFASNQLQTLCIDRADGRVLWTRDLPPGSIERGAHLGNPATATPCTDGQRVYVYFGAFGLACYGTDGTEIWRKPLPVPVTQHGAGTSPILAGSALILNSDQDVGSYLLAVDPATGRTLWRTERGAFKRGFSTPLPWPAENPQHVIVAGTLRLAAYDLKDGSEVWSVAGLPNEMVSSPVAGGGLIYIAGWTHGSGVSRMPPWGTLIAADSNGDAKLSRDEAPAGPAKQHFVYIDADKDGLVTQSEYKTIAAIFDSAKNVALAIRPGGKGDVTDTHVVWQHTRGLPYCPTPLFYDGKLYFVKNGGLTTCLDAATGKVFYQEERLGTMGDNYASPVAANGKICIVAQPGVAVVIKAGETLEVLAKNALGEAVVATPAIVDNTLLVRGQKTFFAFREAADAPDTGTTGGR